MKKEQRQTKKQKLKETYQARSQRSCQDVPLVREIDFIDVRKAQLSPLINVDVREQ